MKTNLRHSALLLVALAGLVLHQACGEIVVREETRGRVGTFFFFWHDCGPNPNPDGAYPYLFGPDENCNQRIMPYSPVNMNRPRVPYSARNLEWYVEELKQMKLAGIDYIFPVYWGDHPVLTFFNTDAVELMVEALELLGSDLKIGLFDDTTSQVAQWNFDNGRRYLPSPALNIADQSVWVYFYERKVQRFFRAVPQRFWATHNGHPVSEGGRPIIITWIAEADAANPDGPAFFSFHGAAASLWNHVKERFQQEFGVEPFLIPESSWYAKAPDLDHVGDAQYSWGAAAFHAIWHDRNDYVISSVGPGFDDRLLRNQVPGGPPGRLRRRDLTHDTTGLESLAEPDAFFRNEYLNTTSLPNWPHHGVRADSQLVLVETWNELFEGTGIEPMTNFTHPQDKSRGLAADTYVQTMRELKKTKPGYSKYDHTIVSGTESPGGIWTLVLRNDGTADWTAGDYRLGYRIVDSGNQIVHEAILNELPHDVPFGGTVELRFPQPPEWTNVGQFPASAMILDMRRGETWFTSLGDGFLTRAVTPRFAGFF